MYASVRVRGTEKKGNEYVRLSDIHIGTRIHR